MKTIEVEKSLDETFKKIQKMKQKKQADYKTKLKYNNYILPAGSYKNFESFMICFGAINNYYDSNDENTINYIRKTVFDTTKKMNYDEKIEALFDWDKYYKTLKGENIDLFNREIILDLNFVEKGKSK